jgi:PAS domain S-box-containing protein
MRSNIVNVLLIDDLETNLRLFEAILDFIPEINVESALSGKEAIDKCKNEIYGLIICDINMPDLSGYETISLIRNITGFNEVSVIFVSASHITETDILKGLEIGAVDYLPKPFSNELFLGKVSIHLKLYRQKLKLEEKNKELQLSKSFIENINSSIQAAIIQTDNSGKINYWSKSAVKLFNYEPENIIGKEIYNVITCNDYDNNTLRKLFENGKCSNLKDFMEITAINNHQVQFPAEISVSSIESSDQCNVVFVIREASLKKIIEKHKLEEKELKEANIVMSDFIDNINHEFRTPLNQILGISNNIIKYDQSILKTEQLDGIQIIAREGKKLLSIIENILDFKNINPVKYSYISIHDILSFIKSVYKQLKVSRNIELNTNIEPGFPENIYTDIVKYKTIIEQILSNAIKFTDAGKVNILFTYEKDSIITKIQDTGSGIDLNDIENIFKEFRQLGSKVNFKNQGVGIGLALANKYVKQLQGKIDVESYPGKGSVFSVFLPIIEQDVT